MKKKIRIAVAIDHTGAWSSSGWGGIGNTQKDDFLMGFAVETLENGENQYWLEAELDIPEPVTIKCEPIAAP